MKKKILTAVLVAIFALTCALPLVACGIDTDEALDRNNKANKMQAWLTDNNCANLKAMFENAFDNYKMRVSPVECTVSGSESEGYTYSDYVYKTDAMMVLYSSDDFSMVDFSEYVTSSDDESCIAYAVEEIDPSVKVYSKASSAPDNWTVETKSYSNATEKEAIYNVITENKSPMYSTVIANHLVSLLTKENVETWYKQRQSSASNGFRLSSTASDSYFVSENSAPKLKYIVRDGDTTKKFVKEVSPSKFYYTGVAFTIAETAENSNEYKLASLTYSLHMFDDQGNHYGLLVDFDFDVDMTEYVPSVKA